MNRNALIIQMRSKAVWQQVLPRLGNYEHYYELKSPQNPTISENDCPDYSKD